MIEEKREARVLHVLGSLKWGGAELRTLELAEELQKDGLAFEFLALGEEEGPLSARCRDLGFPVHHLKRNLRFPLRLFLLIRGRRIQVVHSHVHLFSGLILLVARLAGAPGRISHFRSTADGRGRGLFRAVYRRLMKWLLLANATAVVAVSKSAMDSLWAPGWRLDGRFQVIYSGIQTEFATGAGAKGRTRTRLGISRSCFLSVNVANFRAAKNHERLVAIFGELVRRLKSGVLVLAGDHATPTGRRVRRMVHDLGLEARCLFLGQLDRPGVAELLVDSNVMIHPSLWEGLPGVVLEACAVGLPVVASAIPAHEELAEVFPNVVTVALSEPDSAWADEVIRHVASCERPPGHECRVRISTGPFGFDEATRRFRSLWLSQAGLVGEET